MLFVRDRYVDEKKLFYNLMLLHKIHQFSCHIVLLFCAWMPVGAVTEFAIVWSEVETVYFVVSIFGHLECDSTQATGATGAFCLPYGTKYRPESAAGQHRLETECL